MSISNLLKFIPSLFICILFIRCQEKFNERFLDKEAQNIPASQIEEDLGKITWVDKIGEIKDGFCEEEYNYFGKITSICVDEDDNIYVADSELHKIFIFNSEREYIDSFGIQGQGPGEFLGTLRISIGNDGKLYVTDDGNWRLLVFSTEGKLITQFPIRDFLRDKPIINSKGEIYLLSPSRLKVIDIFDKDIKLKKSLLEMNYHLDFPFISPTKKMLPAVLQPSISNVKKLLTKDDRLIVIFNNTQIVILLDNDHLLAKKFKIDHPRFIKDYKFRLNESILKGGWLDCFGSAFFDSDGNICLCYYNASLNSPEVYRYRKNGTFVDALRVKDINVITNRLFVVCDKKGNLFSINQDLAKIIIYRLPS